LSSAHAISILIAIGSHANEDHAMTTDAPDRILRLNTVLDRTGLSRSTLYRKVDQGTFPPQVRIAARCVGWRESAISDWLHNPMFYSVEDKA
jgi:prophage regulatory protein